MPICQHFAGCLVHWHGDCNHFLFELKPVIVAPRNIRFESVNDHVGNCPVGTFDFDDPGQRAYMAAQSKLGIFP